MSIFTSSAGSSPPQTSFVERLQAWALRVDCLSQGLLFSHLWCLITSLFAISFIWCSFALLDIFMGFTVSLSLAAVSPAVCWREQGGDCLNNPVLILVRSSTLQCEMHLLFRPEHQAPWGLQFHFELLNFSYLVNDFIDIVGICLHVEHQIDMNANHVTFIDLSLSPLGCCKFVA